MFNTMYMQIQSPPIFAYLISRTCGGLQFLYAKHFSHPIMFISAVSEMICCM